MSQPDRPIVWIDNVDIDYNPDDDWLYDFQVTLALQYEHKAEDCEADGPGGQAMARTLRQEAARIRASGCRTAEEWLARTETPEA